MHQSHIENLKAVVPNFQRAVRDQQLTIIGGGEFSPEVVNSVLLAIAWALARQAQVDLENQ